MSKRIKASDLPKAIRDQLPKKRHKYGAIPTVVDGIRFASQKEARRYGELKLLRRQGRIACLVLQPRYELNALGGGKVGYYVADFIYDDLRTGCTIIEDVKGMRTPLYKWKKKHAQLQWGIVITEV